jgi:hypothetical protein
MHVHDTRHVDAWLLAAMLAVACVLPSSASQLPALAVTMPFTSGLLPRIPRTFDFWRQYPPCDTTRPRAQNVSFVFQFNRVITEDLRRELEALWASLGDASRCFASLLFVSVNQTDEQESNKIVAGCHQHYNTFAQMRSLGFQHWLQYETDVLPVRANWLQRIADEAERNDGCTRWWVQGASQGYNLATVTTHERVDGVMLNGNALYCINDEVLAYLEDVKSQFPPIGCHDNPRRHANRRRLRLRAPSAQLWGFDTIQYWYRTDVENRAKLQGMGHLFQSVDWIADLHQMSRDCIERVVDARPSLVMLHSKSYFNDTRSSWDYAVAPTRTALPKLLLHLLAAFSLPLALLAARSSRKRLALARTGNDFGAQHVRW